MSLLLKGLAYPDKTKLKDAEHFDAVKLFVQRAKRARPGFDPDEDLAAILAICELVEGLPLGT